MTLNRSMDAALFAAAALPAGNSPPPAAHDRPSKPLHMVMPGPVGGLADTGADYAVQATNIKLD